MENDLAPKHNFLYYIFLKDSEENRLSAQMAQSLWLRILKAIKNDTEDFSWKKKK